MQKLLNVAFAAVLIGTVVTATLIGTPEARAFAAGVGVGAGLTVAYLNVRLLARGQGR